MNPQMRRKARRLALQAIYQWQQNPEPINEIEQQYLAEANSKKVDTDYFTELTSGVVYNLKTIDAAITPYLDRKLDELNPIELAIIRIATFELLQRKDIPPKVAINEAVEIAKVFGAEDGHKYVNGVLDKIASKLG